MHCAGGQSIESRVERVAGWRCRTMIDAHVHFYDPGRKDGIDWPPENSPHFGPRLPDDWQRASSASACVAVETSRRSRDDDWLLALASRSPSIAGVVLNLQPDQAGFPARLERASELRKFAGIRLRPIRCYDWSSTALMANLELTARQGKSIEFGAVDDALKDKFAELAKRFDTTTWILDHAGHPAMDGASSAEWLRAMQAIAQRPNVVVKATKMQENLPQRAELLSGLLDTFGARRLLYGSNWPLCAGAEFSAATLAMYRACLGSASDDFFCTNAERVYGIERPPVN